jgi:two-component system sensor histidine kinase/response regulator
LHPIGIQKYWIKPVRTVELVNAIGTLMSFGPVKPNDTSVALEVSAKKRAQGGATLEILLAEDNLVNQKLATRLLQKLGHNVVEVGNGKDPGVCQSKYSGSRLPC